MRDHEELPFETIDEWSGDTVTVPCVCSLTTTILPSNGDSNRDKFPRVLFSVYVVRPQLLEELLATSLVAL